MIYPFLVNDLFMSWNLLPLSKKARKLGTAVLLCLIWEIWKERNRSVYEDVPFFLPILKSSFIRTLISWAGLINVGECSALLLDFFCQLFSLCCGKLGLPFFYRLGLP